MTTICMLALAGGFTLAAVASAWALVPFTILYVGLISFTQPSGSFGIVQAGFSVVMLDCGFLIGALFWTTVEFMIAEPRRRRIAAASAEPARN